MQALDRFAGDGGVSHEKVESLQPIATLCRSLFD